MITVDFKMFREFLFSATYKGMGDIYEREFGDYLKDNFPNHEYLWKIMVVPLTKRVDPNSSKIGDEIGFREGIDCKLIQMASSHYSIFLNLMFTRIHLKNKLICSPENIFMHLGTVCDLVEKFIIDWYLIKSKCENEEVPILDSLSEKDFLELAKEWYQKRYSKLYEDYFSKGKHFPIRIPTRQSIFDGYLLPYNDCKKKYLRISLDIRHYRNIIAHGNRIGRIIDKEDKQYIPNQENILKYKSWIDIESATSDKEIFENDFVEIWNLLNQIINELENTLDSLWKIVINDFNNLFFELRNETLLYMFKIKFSGDKTTSPLIPHQDLIGIIDPIATLSGTFTSGSGSTMIGNPEELE